MKGLRNPVSLGNVLVVRGCPTNPLTAERVEGDEREQRLAAWHDGTHDGKCTFWRDRPTPVQLVPADVDWRGLGAA